jgi:hypothetical protein
VSNVINGGCVFTFLLATLIVGQPAVLVQPNADANRARDKQVLTLLSHDMKHDRNMLRSDELALSAAYGLLGHDVRSGALIDAAEDVDRVNQLAWAIVQDIGDLSADRQLVVEDRRDLRGSDHPPVVTPAALVTGAV